MAGAEVGSDCNIGEHAFVETGARVGDRVTVKNGVMIWDGVTIEDDVFLGPGTVFTNDLFPRIGHRVPAGEFVRTTVRKGASIGANCTIVCGVTVGNYAMVGAGSVVTKNIADHALLVGNPARPVGWVCRCGQRLDDGYCCSCHLNYALVDDNGLTESSSLHGGSQP
jgi:acetyltransferase-like isoleucine patch superfamily enzyme